jgi:NhaP-type Na+/H+ and K+/H+ antiporter
MNVKSKAALSTLGVVVMSSLIGALTYFIMEFIPLIYVLVGMVSGVSYYIIYLVYVHFKWKYEIEEREQK